MNLDMNFCTPLSTQLLCQQLTFVVCLVDYLGYRIVATSLMPIDSTTIVSGSSDGGYTGKPLNYCSLITKVHSYNTTLNAMLEEAAKHLNIAPHYCGRSKGILLHTAGDMEGHLGKDGKFYLCDFSRVLPPEYPKAFPSGKIRCTHLFRLLRPELVQAYKKPLCNDAFSGFVHADPDAAIYNEEIKEATTFLLEKVVPECAKDMDNLIKNRIHRSIRDINVVDILHSHGVNLRWMGKGMILLHKITNFVVKTLATTKTLEILLLHEMVQRVVKNYIRERLRKAAKELGIPLEGTFAITHAITSVQNPTDGL